MLTTTTETDRDETSGDEHVADLVQRGPRGRAGDWRGQFVPLDPLGPRPSIADDLVLNDLSRSNLSQDTYYISASGHGLGDVPPQNGDRFIFHPSIFERRRYWA